MHSQEFFDCTMKSRRRKNVKSMSEEMSQNEKSVREKSGVRDENEKVRCSGESSVIEVEKSIGEIKFVACGNLICEAEDSAPETKIGARSGENRHPERRMCDVRKHGSGMAREYEIGARA